MRTAIAFVVLCVLLCGGCGDKQKGKTGETIKNELAERGFTEFRYEQWPHLGVFVTDFYISLTDTRDDGLFYVFDSPYASEKWIFRDYGCAAEMVPDIVAWANNAEAEIAGEVGGKETRDAIQLAKAKRLLELLGAE